MHFKRAILLSGWLILSTFPLPGFAEREIHSQNPDGTVSIVIERTPQEQARADVSYDHPTLGTVTYFDSYTGKPITKENFQATYEAQLNMVRDNNNRIVEEAQDAFKQDAIDRDEFVRVHGQIKMANAGLEATRNQTVSTIQQSKPKPENQTADSRLASKILVQKSRVLVG